MLKYYRITLIGLFALALMGCASPESSNSQATPTVPNNPKPSLTPTMANSNSPQPDAKLVATSNKFGFNLFERVAKQDENIFISPSSVAIALSMVYNGAKGDTQTEIAKTLELQGISVEDVNKFNRAFQQMLTEGDKGVELNIANSVWVRNDVPLKQDFLNQVQKFYQSEVTNLDFRDPNAVNIINNWVKQSTKDKIDTIVDRIDRDSLMFLINAVYFNGKWEAPFDKSRTQPKPFTLANGKKIQHPAMSRSGEYRYYDAPTFQAINLPYGSGRFGMQVFLPKPNSNLAEFQKQLTTSNWQEWSTKFVEREGLIQLPRFKMEYEITLKSILKDMGMVLPFSNQADFSNLSDASSTIHEVRHKTFVDVTEEGTEAAAVTSIEMRVTSAMPSEEPPFQMIVDRPFFFAISDRKTGAIIFMGSIKNPS
ncbi:serpin family protein [Pseudanabaena mucicola]|uniref:Serpin family protein n=1 Tax=Pseudanabaena mucicola FACHB-723 TaxID=2692860 RepID=A0ABR7ZU17_9CYAN|nr:serpin family protein [Pseudanabaena mucicola]MBD2186868.1 serpin family protein [Pseudanabaena mucicola FACHB-723]